MEPADNEEDWADFDVLRDTTNNLYYTACTLYIIGIIVCAVFIDDLTLIFGFLGAVSETTLNFIFPGLFFLYAARNMTIVQCKFKMCAYMSVTGGSLFFLISNSFNVLKTLRI